LNLFEVWFHSFNNRRNLGWIDTPHSQESKHPVFNSELFAITLTLVKMRLSLLLRASGSGHDVSS